MRGKPFSSFIWITISVILLSVVSLAEANASFTESMMLPQNAALSRAAGEAQPIYHVQSVNQQWQSRNPAYALHAEFMADGVRFTHDEAIWQLAVQQVGYAAHLYTPQAAAISVDMNRVEYRRGDLIEWYINGTSGIQQGFTFLSPPEGAAQDDLLTVSLRMDGTVYPQLQGDQLVLVDDAQQMQLSYGGLVAFDANGDYLPVQMTLDGSSLLLQVDERGAVYPVTIDPFIQSEIFTNPTAGTDDYFGTTVAASGSTIIIGAPFDNAGGNDSGVAYIYDSTTGSLEHTLTNPSPGSGDQFGAAVAISGSTVVIGAPWDNTLNSDSGVVYIYNSATGNLIHTLTNPTPGAMDLFGASVAIAGNTVVVGAPLDNINGTDSGVVYIFDSATGNLLQTITNPTPGSSDEFGRSVAIAGSTVVVGAPLDNSTGNDSGSVYVFDRATGNLLDTVSNPTPATGDSFGEVVNILGNDLLIGVPNDNAGSTNSGVVYLFGQNADYGDAPEVLGYPTQFANDGARHAVLAANNPTLGATVDTEADGFTNADANGDDLDNVSDEDGVVFASTFVPGRTINVTVSAGAAGGNLDAWVDWNQDGDWDDADEQIAASLAIAANSDAILAVNVPATAIIGDSFARFRFSSAGGLTPIGQAADGEVEDYAVAITNQPNDDDDDDDDAPAPAVVDAAGNPVPVGIFDPTASILGLILPEGNNSQAEWIVTVSNQTDATGVNVSITSEIDPRLRVTRVDAPGARVDINGQLVTITYPVFDPNGTQILSIFTSAINGEILENTACVRADNQPNEKCVAGRAVSALPLTGESLWLYDWLRGTLWLLVLAVVPLLFALRRMNPKRER